MWRELLADYLEAACLSDLMLRQRFRSNQRSEYAETVMPGQVGVFRCEQCLQFSDY